MWHFVSKIHLDRWWPQERERWLGRRLQDKGCSHRTGRTLTGCTDDGYIGRRHTKGTFVLQHSVVETSCPILCPMFPQSPLLPLCPHRYHAYLILHTDLRRRSSLIERYPFLIWDGDGEWKQSISCKTSQKCKTADLCVWM